MSSPGSAEPLEAPVIVTGAGGPAGVAVIRALQQKGLTTVGVDADPLSPGLRIAGEGAVLPDSDDPSYPDQLCRLAEKTASRSLISTLSEEMPRLQGRRRMLADAGLRFWLAEPGVVRTCIDKWRFAQAMKFNDLPAPRTALSSAHGVPGPWVVKPRYGRGSRDIHFIDQRVDLGWAMGRVPEPLVQTRLDGREFTVDVLASRGNDVLGAVPRWRLQAKAGVSVKGETFADERLMELVRRLVAALGIEGPANVQGFAGDDGTFQFTEVNPRFSGGLPLSLASGAEFVTEYLRGVHGLPVRPLRLAYRAGVRMIRHYEEIFEG